MRIFSLFLVLFTSVVSGLKAQTPATTAFHLLIGTYATEGKPTGIHVYKFNAQTGELQIAQPVMELADASYLAISKDSRNVYAATGSKVHGLAFDPASGALTLMNSVPAQGSCYVTVDSQKKAVFAANYGGGNVEAIRLKTDGSLDESIVQFSQHKGSSANKDRQEGPHTHSAVLSLDERYLLAPDLGADKVYGYSVGVDGKQMLTPMQPPFLATPPGAGPRHVIFHPNGQYAYLVLELQGAVMALDFTEGKLSVKQTVSMVAPEFTGRLSGADIHVSPDGKFLYASNRGGANEIAIYSIDKEGLLTLIDRQPVLGKTPRNFAIDPTGNFLLVANQESNEVVVFRRNSDTGLLAPTGTTIAVDKPVCLKFTEAGG